MTKIQLENASPSQLATALKNVITIVEQVLIVKPDAQWIANCPVDSVWGNFDDTWSDAQDNGEAWLARQINVAAKNQAPEKALEAIDYLTARIEEARPNVEWVTNCPEEALTGSYDDTWEQGQDNGEAYIAIQVRQAIATALESGSNL